jgi:hypothetical protein
MKVQDVWNAVILWQGFFGSFEVGSWYAVKHKIKKKSMLSLAATIDADLNA